MIVCFAANMLFFMLDVLYNVLRILMFYETYSSLLPLPGFTNIVLWPLTFYRTHVHMGSDHWVANSVRPSQNFVT